MMPLVMTNKGGMRYHFGRKASQMIHLDTKMQKEMIRVDVDDRSEKIGYKIREAQLSKVPYMLVVGDKEAEENKVSVRDRKDGDIGQMNVDEFIEKMPQKYDTYIEQGGSNVSGGQKQRLCIARALLKKPKILILDDSTSAVDTATDAKIRAALANEIPDTTKLIIAQRISSIQGADRIIVLENGCVSGFGTHEELMEKNRIYRDVYESQMSGNGDFDEKEANV